MTSEADFDKKVSQYASYANHCAIQKKIPMTWHTWKRSQPTPAPKEQR